MPGMDYEAACVAAATEQGLDPLTAALTEAGVPFAVEQTGGFTMVVTVTVPSGVFAMTADVEVGEDAFLLAYYPGATWTEGGDPDTVCGGLPYDEVVRQMENAQQIGAQACG